MFLSGRSEKRKLKEPNRKPLKFRLSFDESDSYKPPTAGLWLLGGFIYASNFQNDKEGTMIGTRDLIPCPVCGERVRATDFWVGEMLACTVCYEKASRLHSSPQSRRNPRVSRTRVFKTASS